MKKDNKFNYKLETKVIVREALCWGDGRSIINFGG